jgi:hypothetical protein
MGSLKSLIRLSVTNELTSLVRHQLGSAAKYSTADHFNGSRFLEENSALLKSDSRRPGPLCCPCAAAPVSAPPPGSYGIRVLFSGQNTIVSNS